jgi:hypothetical protein
MSKRINKNDFYLCADAINKFMYYTWNYNCERIVINEKAFYVPDVILHADWSCNVDHMVGKWLSAKDCNVPHAYFSEFYGELDGTNRRAMIYWIMDNYNDEISL